MSREYVLSGANQTLTGAVTLAFLNPGTTSGFEVLRVWVSQSGTTTQAMVRVQMNTQVSVFPTLVSATPAKTKLSDPISLIVGGTAGAAGTCGINASAEGAGAKSVILSDAFNNLSGWLWVPTPQETIIMNAGASSGFGLHLPAAPASLTGWTFGVVYREI